MLGANEKGRPRAAFSSTGGQAADYFIAPEAADMPDEAASIVEVAAAEDAFMVAVAADEAASMAEVPADEAAVMADVAASEAAMLADAVVSAAIGAVAGSTTTGAGAGATGSSFLLQAANEMAVANEAIRTAVLMVLLEIGFKRFSKQRQTPAPARPTLRNT